MSQQSQMSTAEWLDQYEVLDVIGNGMFGVIRKVKHKRTGEILARKDLNFEKMSEKDRKQIVAEVNILKDLSHPSIVRYHDRHVDRDNGYLYILMEYCGGGDLSRYLAKARKRGQPLSEETVWSYFHQILQALEHCHHPPSNNSSPTSSTDNTTTSSSSSSSETFRRMQQVLHRDIKPENIFLTDDGKLKLGDFGLSKAMGPATFASTYVGTPYYMSPEMLDEKAYDNKSDVWSLGCLIFELCALEPPYYAAKTQTELTQMIRSGRIPLLPKGYSTQLYQIIRSMLQLRPGSRPSIQNLLANERFVQVSLNSEAHALLDEARRKKRENDAQQKLLEQRQAEIEISAAQIREELTRERTKLGLDRAAFEQERRQLLSSDERRKLVEERTAFEEERTRCKLQLESELREYAFNKQMMDNTAAEFSMKYEAFERERQDFLREKEAWRQQQQQAVASSRRVLEDIQNSQTQKNTVPLPGRYQPPHDDSPCKVVAPASRRPTPQDQNVAPSYSQRDVAAPGSAPTDDKSTPSTRRLASKSNPNLGSAMRGVILTASGVAVDTPWNVGSHQEVIPPVPALPALTTLLAEAATRMSLDSPGSTKKLSESLDESPRPRIRRRSTISVPSLAANRPSVGHASTMPTNIPAPAFNPASLPPPPVYDLDDEENLPSPFVKKGVPETNPKSGAKHWGSTITAGLKKGPGLWGQATANSAATAKTFSSSSTSGSRSRPSVSRVFRANEEAQKAYASAKRAVA